MEEKIADNKIIEVKKQLVACEDNLVEAKDALRGIEDLEDSFSHLNRNIERCIDILNSSVKNRKVIKKLDHMIYDNKVSYRRTNFTLDEEKEITQEKINELNDKIDELNKEIKEINKKIEIVEEQIEEKKEETEE